MAKFRRNHEKQGRGGLSTIRLVVFTIFLFMLLIIPFKSFITSNFDSDSSPSEYMVPAESEDSQRYFLPASYDGELIHHKYYSFSYAEEHELAEWVAYELTKSSLQYPNVKRSKRYETDRAISSGSASYKDYSNSGYTRGHLAPAGDMAFNEEAMEESFLMSNISPQLRAFNNGIWKELEENVRDWAYKNDRLFIVTGPLLNRPVTKKIGRNGVSVPSAFYKVILDIDNPDQKGIGFIIPNLSSENRLQDYIVSIDSIESETGLDFFADLLQDELEEKLESTTDNTKWSFSEKRYNLRVEHWNRH